MYNDFDNVDKSPADAEPSASANSSKFEHDRVETRAGEDGHYWQVLVDGAWQSGRCAPGCETKTATEHVG